MNISQLIKRYQVLTYFLLTFAISWGGLLFVIGGLNQLTVLTQKFNELLPLVILAILAGPSTSGILLTLLIDGKEGLHNLKLNLTKKINIRWYLYVLLAAPLTVSVVYTLLSFFYQNFSLGILSIDNKTSHLIMGLVTGVAAGLFEETGWTGFATPRLLKKNSLLKTGLIIGFVWAIWHILPGLWLGYASGTINNTISLISYVSDPFFFLVIYRILMVWVYNQTKNLSLAMVMHGSLTASARIFTPLGIVGVPLLVFGFVWTFVVAVIAILVFRRQE